jgi:uncharacterized membrane protein YbhN (UPF0104 family)
MNAKALIFLVAKALFAVGILTWLFSRIDGAALLASLSSAKAGPIAAALFLCVAAIGVAAWRWLKLLGLFGIGSSLRELFSIVWIGQFFSMFLPGPLGDDASRMVYISRMAPRQVGEACLSVLIDRGLGLCSVFVLCLFAVPLQWPLLTGNSQTLFLGSFALAGGFSVAAVGIFFLLFGRTSSSSGLFRLLPAGRLQTELLRLWNLATGNKALFLKVLSAALLVQLFNCLIFWLAGLAVGVHLPLLAWVNFVPVILAANILPITIAGLGVREYLVVLFLGVANGIPEVQAMAASLLVFALMVVVSALGGLVFVLYRGHGRQFAESLSAKK